MKDRAFWLTQIQCYADGQLGQAEVAELSAALKQDASLRRDFLELLNLDSAIENYALGEAVINEVPINDTATAGSLDVFDEPSLPVAETAPQNVARRDVSRPGKPHAGRAANLRAPSVGKPSRRSPVLGFLDRMMHVSGDTPVATALMWMVMFLCTGMLLTMIIGIIVMVHSVNVHVDAPQVTQQPAISPSPPHPLPPVPVAVARLIHTSACQWAGGGDAPTEGDDLVAGRKLVLTSGLAEIMFQSGARAVLQGPATLQVASKTSALLQHGKVTVTAEQPEAHGFEIHTPGMKVTDLGTEFGVLIAKDGSQEVHVFRGSVKAEQAAAEAESGSHGGNAFSPSPPRPLAPSSAPFTLTAGEAVHVASPAAVAGGGKPIERIVAHTEQFVRALPRHPYELPVVNGSFEYPVVKPGGVNWTTGVDGWSAERNDNWGVHLFTNEFLERNPDGKQLGFLNEGQIWQVLPVSLAANTKYVLTFSVGNRPGVNSPNYTAELAAGNTVLVSADNPAMPAKGYFDEAKLTFVCPSNHPALGQPLKIVFRSKGSLETHTQNIFDDVQLQAIPNK